jgi:hypothetical protein
MLFECDDGNQVVLAFSTILQCALSCMAASFINLKEQGFFFWWCNQNGNDSQNNLTKFS